jgi:hypothetical protein
VGEESREIGRGIGGDWRTWRRRVGEESREIGRRIGGDWKSVGRGGSTIGKQGSNQSTVRTKSLSLQRYRPPSLFNEALTQSTTVYQNEQTDHVVPGNQCEAELVGELDGHQMLYARALSALDRGEKFGTKSDTAKNLTNLRTVSGGLSVSASYNCHSRSSPHLRLYRTHR